MQGVKIIRNTILYFQTKHVPHVQLVLLFKFSLVVPDVLDTFYEIFTSHFLGVSKT
jgi:hypothetical protein